MPPVVRRQGVCTPVAFQVPPDRGCGSRRSGCCRIRSGTRPAYGVVVAATRLIRSSPGNVIGPGLHPRSAPMTRPRRRPAPVRDSGGRGSRGSRSGAAEIVGIPPGPTRTARAETAMDPGGAMGSTTAMARASGDRLVSDPAPGISPVSVREPAVGPSGTTAGFEPRNDGVLPTTAPSSSVTWIATWWPPTRQAHAPCAPGSPNTANQ